MPALSSFSPPASALRHDERALEALVPAATKELAGPKGSGEALSQLASTLFRILKSCVNRDWGNALPDVEQVVSEALQRVLCGLHKFDPSKGSLVGWSVGIAKKVASQHFMRNAARQKSTGTVFEREREARMSLQETLSARQRNALRDAILELSADDHALLHLLLVDNLDANEAAERFAISHESVRKKKSILLRRLQKTAQMIIQA